MDIYQYVPQYILVLFSECDTMNLDYTMMVSSVAIGANGIVTFTKILPEILETNNQRARYVFLTHVLQLISKLNEEKESYTKKLCQVQEKQINDAESEELRNAAKAKETVSKNEAMIAQAKNLFFIAKSSSLEVKKGYFFPCISFFFVFLSILVLVFSPQIAKCKIHNFWLIFLFIPQIIAVVMLLYVTISKFFPLKYIKQICSVRRNLWEKIFDAFYFEWDVLSYRPANNKRVTNEIESNLSVSSTEN